MARHPALDAPWRSALRRLRSYASQAARPVLAVAFAGLAAWAGAVPGAPPVETPRPAAGFDFLTTDAKGTYFTFTGGLGIPQGFFDAGSAAFRGRVAFRGTPIGTFKGQKTASADTVIERKNMPRLGPRLPASGTAEIELAALSMASVDPIRVQVGRQSQLWDVQVGLSSHRPSRGKMVITQRDPRGGTFDSELTVFAAFRFVRRGDRAERTLDLGTLQLGPESLKELTLRATRLAWQAQPPRRALVLAGLSDGFFPGGQALQVGCHPSGNGLEIHCVTLTPIGNGDQH